MSACSPLWMVFLLLVAGCGSSGGVMTRPVDLTTPEAAVLSLEEAYRARDIDAAVKCKDFRTEATLMLEKLNPELAKDEEIIVQTTDVLELAFRAEMKQKGFPDFSGVTSTFKDKKPFRNRSDIVEMTETCVHDGGSTTTNQVILAKTETGWRMVVIAD
jgi:hypothetical protein